MAKKFTLLVGLNDKDTKKQRISTIEAYKIVENIIVEKVGGGSIYEGRGVYKHEDGKIVIENSLQVQLFDCEVAKVYEIIEALKLALNQESIILETEEVESRFV